MTTATSAPPLHHGSLLRVETAAAARQQHWYWLAVGLVLFFLIPFVLTDLVSIDRDLYYGIYIVAVFGFFAAWVGCANDSPRAVLTAKGGDR